MSKNSIKPVLDYRNVSFRRDPFETYKRLRQDNPVVRGKIPMMGEAWMVTRYEDVVALYRDPRLKHNPRALPEGDKNMRRLWWLPRVLKIMTESMIILDDPDHIRLRRLASKAFSANRIRAIEMQIREASLTLAENVGRMRTKVDVINEFAIPLPLTVIAGMIGVSPAHRERFRKLAGGFVELGTRPIWELPLNIIRGEILLRDLGSLIEAHRVQQFDDLLNDLVQAEIEGDRLSHRELLAMIMLLMLAGHETTSNLISISVLELIDRPDDWHRLRNEETLPDQVVEELLRFTSPVEHGVPRYATEDMEIAGQPIARGDTVIPVLASANRDESVFTNPDTLDFDRHPNRHLAFGMGGHMCLGAPLARMEVKHALPMLLNLFPKPSLAVDRTELIWRPSTAARGLRTLPMLAPA